MENEIENALKDKFMSQTKFSLDIENLVESTSLSYIESIVHYCKENSIEIDNVSKLISKPLKERIKCEAITLNYLKKTTKAKLPI